MKRTALYPIVCIVVFSFGEFAFAQTLKDKRPIELSDLVSFFSVEDSSKDARLNWLNFSARIQSISKPLDSGIVSGNKTKRLKIPVLLNGTPVKSGDEKKSIQLWKIKISGSAGRIFRVDIDPDEVSYQLAEFSIEKYLSGANYETTLIKCGRQNSGDESSYVYECRGPQKKMFWLQYNSSCGSHGCGIKIYLFNENNKFEDMDNLIECK